MMAEHLKGKLKKEDELRRVGSLLRCRRRRADVWVEPSFSARGAGLRVVRLLQGAGMTRVVICVDRVQIAIKRRKMQVDLFSKG